jgi:Mitochondrial small ribosomal subunit Rsm22
VARPPARGSRIHRGLTGARELVGTRYLADPELRREYVEEIAPRTGAALAKILTELFPPDEAPPVRALDLGAGTGAVGVALRGHFGDGIDVLAVDREPGPGVMVADLSRELPPVEGRFDLIVAAYLLNELFVGASFDGQIEARARRVLVWCRTFLADGGTAILIEPALRETSRALLAVRDRLIASGLHVVAPCFWAGPCPALERERDWCHDSAKVPGAPRVDFAYLALRATPALTHPRTLYRVVSDALPEKGRLKIFGCGAAGRHALVLLDRQSSPSNAVFGELERGDAVTIAGTQFASEGLRLTAGTVVERART